MVEIRLNTVGVIGTGKYTGWYIFVRESGLTVYGEISYTVYICTDTTFAFNPAERECYDSWAQNMPSLEGTFEVWDVREVRWDESIVPPKFGPPSPEMQRFAERVREHFDKARKNKPSDEA